MQLVQSLPQMHKILLNFQQHINRVRKIYSRIPEVEAEGPEFKAIISYTGSARQSELHETPISKKDIIIACPVNKVESKIDCIPIKQEN